MNKLCFVSFVAAVILIAGIFNAEARPEYAQKENKTCAYCHLNAGGGGARGFRGQFYGANGLSFSKYDEARESSIAGLPPDTDAGETRPKVAYVGNVGLPAERMIQSIVIRDRAAVPVLAVFIDWASDNAKTAVKVLHKIALAYGRKVAIVGVARGDSDSALKLTKELGSQIRILPDPDGSAAKKFQATQGLDLVAVSLKGESFKLISGFSKGNLETAIAQLGTYGVEAPQVDITEASAEVIHGGKLGQN